MRGKEIREQPFQAGLAKLPTQVRQLEQIVQIIDGVAERADFAQLFFGGFQVLLHFFELSKAFFDVLIEFLLHLIRDREQLFIHSVANGIEALGCFLVEALKFGFQLRCSERQ